MNHLINMLAIFDFVMILANICGIAALKKKQNKLIETKRLIKDEHERAIEESWRKRK